MIPYLYFSKISDLHFFSFETPTLWVGVVFRREEKGITHLALRDEKPFVHFTLAGEKV